MRFTLFRMLGISMVLTACSDDSDPISEVVTRPTDTQTGQPLSPSDTTDTFVPSDTSDSGGPGTDIGDSANPDITETDSQSDSADTSAPNPDGDTGGADSDVSGPDTEEPGPQDTFGLSYPSTISFPWASAGGAAIEHTVVLSNQGTSDLSLSFNLSNAGPITLSQSPSSLAPGAQANLSLRFSPPSNRLSHEAFLHIEVSAPQLNTPAETYIVPVYAYAGQSSLNQANFSPFLANGITYGLEATVKLPSAPFPNGSSSWTDNSVHLFIPEGFKDRGPVPFVVHFHGHSTTLASTLPAHYYREQHWLSGINAILVTPQGPVNAASGDFGKLMSPGALKVMLADVVDVLYRAGKVGNPYSGDLILTEHSGGYQAVALNLNETTDQGQVLAAHLFDGLYGYSDRYRAFAQGGGTLRSVHTSSGGTRSNNQTLLSNLGTLATSSPTFGHFRDSRAVIWPTDAGHNQSTWHGLPFAETLRWTSRHAKRGPRVELRFAYVLDGQLHLNLLSPEDDYTTAIRVERSENCQTWTLVERLAPHLRGATLPWEGEACLRLRSEVEGLPLAESQTSDVAWLSSESTTLVVNGFDRRLGGSWFEATHSHAARVGKAAKASAYASNEAIAEDELTLGNFRTLIWLTGDQSTNDNVLPSSERSRITTYLNQGGKAIISGSEIAYALRSSATSFLTQLGASYVADDANRNSAYGVGPLAALSEFSFGTSAAPYLEDYPDVINASNGAEALLRYSSTQIAATGKPSQSIFVGFPLETVVSESVLATLMQSFLSYLHP